MKLASFSVGGYGYDYETCKKKEQPQSHKVHIAREKEAAKEQTAARDRKVEVGWNTDKQRAWMMDC